MTIHNPASLMAAIHPPSSPWKVLVIDDDPDIHVLTLRTLRHITFENVGIVCHSGYSSQDARTLIQNHPDAALILLDVAMETEEAGLNLVRFIRDEANNHFVRIILHTGQVEKSHILQVINEYDVNGFKEKSDFSPTNLIATVLTAFRSYRDLRTIEQLATSKEILEKKVAEGTEALVNSQESLALAQRVAHFGNWDWNLQSNQFQWSQEICHIFGQSPYPNWKSWEEMVACVLPEDQERVRQVIRSVGNASDTFRMEYRVLRSDGSLRTLQEVGELFRDKENKPSRLVGVIQDITHIRDAENRLQMVSNAYDQALLEAAGHLRVTSKVFENAIEGVFITNSAGLIQSINPAYCRITGCSMEEVINRPPGMFHTDLHDAAFFEEINRSLMESGKWSGELWNRRNTGEAYPQSLTVTAIFGQNNEILHQVGVFHDLTAIKRHEEELRFKTYHDSLTGLANRELFLDRLQQAIFHCDRTGGKVMVLAFDLDLFKNVNSSLGHSSGDQILRESSRRMLKVIRSGDTASRLAGDSFAFVFREIREIHDSVFIIRKLTQILNQPFEINGHRLFLTASQGVTFFPDDGKDVDTLVRNIDIAVNRAKEAGRNNCQFYTSAMGTQTGKRLFLEEELRKALDREEFTLFYQPKLDVVSGQVVGMEALVRWKHPTMGIVSPAEFIPISEESGLIIPLGKWILKTACLQTKKWLDDGLGPLRMAVNLSAKQFQAKDLVYTVDQVIKESHVPPDALELEITESMVMGDVENAIKILRALKERGLHIAMDDFGTGYSSLNYLKRFPIHTLKIDQTFVRDLTRDSDDAAIVIAIISMAHSLSLQVVAEGVETQEHFDFLKKHKCDEIQGYLISKPLPADDLTRFLEKNRTS
ncbi:MAG: EAL domain-containing protein [Magnetococcales bacterium]|nr:EAL domain-containing protein [Magnetococcales bacterium]NGZ27806.1 EAL domain-containing protein [Magnetococcales bacterium]